jgi:hypothetical protein
LTAPAITAAIIAAGPELKGPNFFQLAGVLGVAVMTWSIVPSNVVVTGVTAGVGGAGAVLGKLTVPPIPLPVNLGMAAAGLVGPSSPSLGRAVGMGVAAAYNASATYVGASAGVAAGGDVSKVTFTNGPALTTIISATAASSGMLGPTMPQLAVGLGNGIAALILTGFGVGTVTGPTGPAPTVGTSLSKVV